jgi:predicted secreted protein
MTEGAAAFGTVLVKGGIGGAEIAEVSSINGLALDSDEVDITHHRSPGGFEEVIQGIRRTGEVTIEGNFVPGDTGGQRALYDDYLTGAIDSYAIIFPPVFATAWTFKAFVKQPPATEAPVEGRVPFTATLRVTGPSSLDITYSVGLTTPFFTISNAAVIVPAPANAVYDYVANVLTGVTSVTVTPTATAGVIKVNGNIVATGQPSGAIALGAAGSVTNITIEVKETGKIARIYRIALARAAS